MTIWQIASGDGRRDYSSMLIRHDLMVLGPGNPGEYDPQTYRALVDRGWLSGSKVGAIAQFAHGVKTDDFVLLRKGQRVVAIGIVADDGYHWNEAFDDVQGWDLQHSHRVIWQDAEAELAQIQQDGALFGNRKQIPMFTKVADSQVLDPIRHLLERVAPRPLNALPGAPSAILDDASLAKELFSTGLSNRATEDVIAALNRQRRMQEWYGEHGGSSGRPTETEVVAHMVLPLLLALGWSEQLLALEWNRIDLAGFNSAPTVRESCTLVCEAKGRGHGLSGVLQQATSYVERLQLRNCNRILLTEGVRYYLYSRANGTWASEPIAYLNAAKPRVRYIDNTSAISALMTLRQA